MLLMQSPSSAHTIFRRGCRPLQAAANTSCRPRTEQQYRCASSSSNRISHQVTGPTQKLKSWESGAKLVKNTQVDNQYLEHIRDVHDPSMHLKTIEDELKGTIGKALGKQGEKVLMWSRLMHQEREKYEDLLEQRNNASDDEEQKRIIDKQMLEHAKQHNLYRKDCLHARWELIVHRQAVGFIVGNHKYVTEKFPVAEALQEGEEGEDDNDDPASKSDGEKKPKKVFGDQLDWWQRIGRWR